MAEAAPSIFNKKATEKLRSPDDLEEYVRVTSPSVWLILGACIALVVGLLAWGFFGVVTSGIDVTGTVVDNTPLCMLSADDVAKVHEGNVASWGSEKLKVKKISDVPVSREEAKQILKSDYLVSTLMDGDWSYVVYFEGDGEYDTVDGTPISISIMTQRVPPISLIFNRG